MLHLWHSPIYTEGIDPTARFPRERYAMVREGLSKAWHQDRVAFREPEPLKDWDALYAVHDRDYVDRFLAGKLEIPERRRIGLEPWTESIVPRTLILTNGTVNAMRQALSTQGIAGNLGGGTHHAYHDFGSGYCIFNDLGIAARLAQQEFGVERILILDLDVHQGDGTAALFAEDPSIRTVSFHCGDNFPFRKMVSDHDEVFPKGTRDAEYLETLQRFLETERSRFDPELIFYQAGVDGLETDRLGHLHLTRGGLRKRNDLVLGFAREGNTPLVLTMGGGYGEPLQSSIEAHVDLFLQAAGKLGSTTLEHS